MKEQPQLSLEQRLELRDSTLFYILLIMIIAVLSYFGKLAIVNGLKLTDAGEIISFLRDIGFILVGFKWGSSVGSKQKDKQLANSIPVAATGQDANTISKTTTEVVSESPAADKKP